jgi:hypothetical protein
MSHQRTSFMWFAVGASCCQRTRACSVCTRRPDLSRLPSCWLCSRRRQHTSQHRPAGMTLWRQGRHRLCAAAATTPTQSFQSAAANLQLPAARALPCQPCCLPSAPPNFDNHAMHMPLSQHASRAASAGAASYQLGNGNVSGRTWGMPAIVALLAPPHSGAASHQLGDGDVAAALGAVVRGVLEEGRQEQQPQRRSAAHPVQRAPSCPAVSRLVFQLTRRRAARMPQPGIRSCTAAQLQDSSIRQSGCTFRV